MKVLCYYNSTDKLQVATVLTLQNKYPSIKLHNVNGLTLSAINALGAGETDGTYDELFVLSALTDAGGTSTMSYDSYALLRAKMKVASQGTLITSGTTTAGTTSKGTLASGSSSVDDFYNLMIIKSTGGTGAANAEKTILDYVGSTLVAEVGGVVWTSPSNDTTYEIYDVSSTMRILNTADATSGKTIPLQVWDIIYSGIEYPLVLTYIGKYLFAQDSGTAASVAAGTLTVATTPAKGDIIQAADRANDTFNDMYVYIISATAGANQYRKITDFVLSSKVCTLESNWTTTPTGTVVYRIVDNLNEVYYDIATELAIDAFLRDVTDTAVQQIWSKLIDNTGNLNDKTKGSSAQDFNYLWTDFIYRGKAILSYNSL